MGVKTSSAKEEEEELEKVEEMMKKEEEKTVMWGCQCLHEANQECRQRGTFDLAGLATAEEEEEEEVSANTDSRLR